MTKDTLTVKTLKQVLGELTYAEMRYVAERLKATTHSLTVVEIAEGLATFADEPTEKPE